MGYFSNMSPDKFEDLCLRLLRSQKFSDISSDAIITPDLRADFLAKDHNGNLTVIEIKQARDINTLNNAIFQLVSLQKLKDAARAILIIPQKAPKKIADVAKGLAVELWDEEFIQSSVENYPKLFGSVKPENVRPGEIAVKSIDLVNFRGFKELHLEFIPSEMPASKTPLTVIVGKNGAGKSSILDAIALSLSWFNRKMINPLGNGSSLAESDIKNGADEAIVKITTIIEKEEVSWELVKARSGRLQSQRSKYKKLDNKIQALLADYITPDRALPLVAYYSIHRAVQDVSVESKDGNDSRVRDLYHGAIAGDRQNFQDFFDWFRTQEDRENQLRNEGNPDYRDSKLEIVRKAVLGILDEFSELKIDRPEDKPAVMRATKGKNSLDVGQLSDGEKCLLGMVGDLARRLAIANPDEAGNPLEGFGVVLIDEIELHLHPQLQRTIIGYLTKIFPNCQFIISTHSAPVVSHVKDFPLVLLENVEGEIKYRTFQAYGQDVNTVLGNIFGMDERPDDVQEEFDAISKLIDQDQYKDAAVRLQKLGSKIGANDPEIVRLESLIHFLSD